MTDTDLLPLPSVVFRPTDCSGIESMRPNELIVAMIARYQDRLLASRDPYAHPDSVAKRYADGVRVKQRLAAHCARMRLSARFARDKNRAAQSYSCAIVPIRRSSL